jgi:hypothetical protein
MILYKRNIWKVSVAKQTNIGVVDIFTEKYFLINLNCLSHALLGT